ncbi:ATP-binding protein [Bounagaea algeriensis]
MNSDEDATGEPDPLAGVADVHFAAVPAEPEQLPGLRRALAEWAGRVGMSAEQIELVALASYEALTNATVHAYSGAGGVLDVHARYLPERAQAQVTVTDSGRWRPEPPERGEQGGRGLVLIRNLAEHAEVTTDASGTAVRMRWTVHTADTAPAA